MKKKIKKNFTFHDVCAYVTTQMAPSTKSRKVLRSKKIMSMQENVFKVETGKN